MGALVPTLLMLRTELKRTFFSVLILYTFSLIFHTEERIYGRSDRVKIVVSGDIFTHQNYRRHFAVL